ncbi:MAG: GC-type dockerin domain-anchored protein [Planctomycetota bacterium]
MIDLFQSSGYAPLVAIRSAAGLALGLGAAAAAGQQVQAFSPGTLPDELRPYVAVDSPEAVIELVGDLRSPDGDAMEIRVVAPADALVTFLPSEAGAVGLLTGAAADVIDINGPADGDTAADIEYTADGSEFFVLCRDSQNLTRFDAATRSFLGEIALDELAIDMAVTLDGRAVIANYLDDSVSIIPLAGGVATTVAVQDAPGTVDISPDGSFAVIGNSADATLSVIDLATNTVVRTIATPGHTQTTSFSPESGAIDFRVTTPRGFISDTELVFVGRFDDVVSVIDVATGLRTDIPTTIEDPFGFDVSGDGSTILIGHSINPGAVTVIDAATLTVDRTIPTVGTRSNGPVALNADGTRAAVSLQNTTRVLNLVTDSFGGELNTSNLNGIEANFDRTRAVGFGFSGAVIDFATGSLLGRANDRVSAAFGAVSPTEDRAAMASTTFGDDLVVIDTDTFPGLLSFGPLGGGNPEGDVSRNTAVSEDGNRAVSSNLFSDSLNIYNANTRGLLGVATLDERPGEVAITPDAATAVGVNKDGFTVSIVDLDSATTTAVPSARRLTQVEISPDGNFAYLAQVASGDGVRKLDLTTNAFVGGLTPTGNLGGVGYSFGQDSQIALSPDGTLLAVASSFTDELFIVETAGMTVTQSFPVGSFPTRVAWSPDQFYILVADNQDDTVTVFFDELDFGSFAQAGVINTGVDPFDMVVLPGNAAAFVLSWGDETVQRLDLSTLTVTGTQPLPWRPMGLSLNADGSRLTVAGGNGSTTTGSGVFEQTSDGSIVVFDTASFAPVDTIETGFAIANLGSGDGGEVVAAASPTYAGGLIVASAERCAVDVNNDGLVDSADFFAWVSAFGSQAPECDVNLDGTCTSADFFAWVSGFSEGCG